MSRKYTPISWIDQRGEFDMLIKIYRPTSKFPEGGLMTQYLESLNLEDTVDMEGPRGKYNYLGNGVF